MKYATSALAIAGMAATVRGHGFLSSPQARMPGTAMQTACGQQVYYNQEGDNYGNIQGELQVAATQSDYDAEACNIWLCKGYKYSDNTASVQSYTAGQTVDIKFDVRAPHTGTANVSIVDTATNTVIGDQLAYWSVFASTATGVSANETSFSITIPSDLGDKCSTAGACVIQHWWDAASIDQTYESCIDFTVGGSGSSSSASSSAVSSAVSSAATSAVASSSSAVSVTTQAAVASTSSAQATSSSVEVAAAAASSSSAVVSSAVAVSSSSAAVSSAVAVSSSSAVVSSAVASSTPASSVVVASSSVEASSSVCSAAEKETVTATITQTVTAVQTVTAGASSSGIKTQAAVVSSSAAASSSPCTTTLTISKSSASASAGFYPYANGTIPAAWGTAVSTGFALPTDVAAPSGTGSPVQALTSVIANIGTAVPSAALTQTVGTAVPSSTSSASPSKSLPSGFTLKDILDWVAYLLSKTFVDAEKEEAAASQPSRRHARDVLRAM